MGRNSKVGALQTRERILDVAGGLFATRGVSSVTFSAIAYEALITPTAVYWHFPTKNDLLLATFERVKRPVALATKTFLAQSEHCTDADFIVAFTLGFYDATVSDEKHSRLLSSLVNYAELIEGTTFSAYVREATQDLLDALIVGFTRASERQLLAPGLDCEQAAHFILGQIVGAVRLVLLSGHRRDACVIYKQCVSVALGMVIGPQAMVHGVLPPIPSKATFNGKAASYFP